MRLLRFFINWLLILTVPIWGGLVVLIMIVLDLTANANGMREIAVGKEWLWK